LSAVAATVISFGAYAIHQNLPLIGALHEAQAEHVDQAELYNLVAAGEHEEAFELAFETGDELFETEFNALDGGGANVGRGQRFTRTPRADLTQFFEWANHFPPRATGPNAQACNGCHNKPFDDGAGGAQSNVHRDPLHSGQLGKFIQRNTPHVFAPGAIQRLAEEMTDGLHRDRDRGIEAACSTGRAQSVRLRTKGVEFGFLTVIPRSLHPCRVDFDHRRVEGVDDDLVIKPLQWKGSELTVRAFNRGASHNELGMQPVEIVGAGVDGDFDGVTDEMTIGDQTAIAIYLAAQPRPTTLLELAALGLAELTAEQVDAIEDGEVLFHQIGCTDCHRSALVIDDPIFSEPSQNPNYRDATFPAGQNPITELVDPAFAVTFDLTADQPDNVIETDEGEFRLGSLRTDGNGGGIVELFGDLKRHYMGNDLEESIDEVGTGAGVWITKELWGVGSTAPYLHDGRATTLTEAILEHGGEATSERRNFESLSTSSQAKVIAFLENLVLFKVEEEE
jgi:cytochrome c peroxidase